MLTRKDLEQLKFLADRDYAFGKRRIERHIRAKYARLKHMGFHSEASRKAHIQQLEAAEDTELHNALSALKGDLEAEYFGLRGMKGIEKALETVSEIFVIPGTSPSSISLTNSKKVHHETDIPKTEDTF